MLYMYMYYIRTVLKIRYILTLHILYTTICIQHTYKIIHMYIHYINMQYTHIYTYINIPK